MENSTEIALIKKSMEDFKDALKELKDSNTEAHKEIKDMIEKAMDSKAGKWVEDAIKWFLFLVMGIVISAIIYSVLKN